MYHPDISQGAVFYLIVNAINKAQLDNSKVSRILAGRKAK